MLKRKAISVVQQKRVNPGQSNEIVRYRVSATFEKTVEVTQAAEQILAPVEDTLRNDFQEEFYDQAYSAIRHKLHALRLRVLSFGATRSDQFDAFQKALDEIFELTEPPKE